MIDYSELFDTATLARDRATHSTPADRALCGALARVALLGRQAQRPGVPPELAQEALRAADAAVLRLTREPSLETAREVRAQADALLARLGVVGG